MSRKVSAFDQQMAALDSRIDADIRQHHTRDVTITVTGPDGRPAANCAVDVEQLASPFLFGANIFMLGSYASDELNHRYEQRFVELFNAATVPLYWKGLEPEQGKPRFAADSKPMHRRPPPDTVVAFCEEHGLNMNGHCLVWDNVRHSIPHWLTDTAHSEPQLEQRIRQIAGRYGGRIQRWDVVNEALNRPIHPDSPSFAVMPPEYERLCFDWAHQCLPPDAHLMINDTTIAAWVDDRRPRYHELIRRLRDGGAKIDGIGLQWHLFGLDQQQRLLDGEWLTPQSMLTSLDEYAEHQLPVHVSEITLHAMHDDGAGRDMQARLTRHVYRLWFSHPAVHAITWWNVPDGGAVPGEDHLPSGLLDEDLQPKPAYAALDQLINHEWRTRATVTTDDAGKAAFRGFFGRYRFSMGDVEQCAEVGADMGSAIALSCCAGQDMEASR